MKQESLTILSGVLLFLTVANAEVSPVRALPVITGYQQQGCAKKGGELTLLGMNFGTQQTDFRVVLVEGGQSTEALPSVWQDNQITVRVPSDARIKEGRLYQVRFQSFKGKEFGTPGPGLKICDEAAAATTPAVPAALPATPAPTSPAVTPTESPTSTERARQQVKAVFNASGGNQWDKVKSMRFTCHVTQDKAPASVTTYDWDVRANTVAVKWDDKQETVDLRKPGTEGDARAAYVRWVNDSYWLLAPLRWLDPMVQFTHAGTRIADDKPYDVLQRTLPESRDFYIDPTTQLITYDELRLPDRAAVTSTWEKYEKFGVLTLATEHKSGDKRIRFTDVAVKTE